MMTMFVSNVSWYKCLHGTKCTGLYDVVIYIKTYLSFLPVSGTALLTTLGILALELCLGML